MKLCKISLWFLKIDDMFTDKKLQSKNFGLKLNNPRSITGIYFDTMGAIFYFQKFNISAVWWVRGLKLES